MLACFRGSLSEKMARGSESLDNSSSSLLTSNTQITCLFNFLSWLGDYSNTEQPFFRGSEHVFLESKAQSRRLVPAAKQRGYTIGHSTYDCVHYKTT